MKLGEGYVAKKDTVRETPLRNGENTRYTRKCS